MNEDVSPFTVRQFYGSKVRCRTSSRNARKAGKKKTWEENLNQELPKLPVPFPHRILGPSSCWRTFYKQSHAFHFLKEASKQDVVIFAFESSDIDPSSTSGQRRYLATSLPVFWHFYKQLDPSKRHHYEIIPEGSQCKLYFDLEYMREFNPGRDGERMVNVLIKYVCLWMKECFDVDCDRSHILDLDASTSSKFSRHLIFQGTDTVFENCVMARNFVRHIFSLLIKHVRLKLKEQNIAHSSVPGKSSTTETHSNICNGDMSGSQAAQVGEFLFKDDFDDSEDEHLSFVAEQCENILYQNTEEESLHGEQALEVSKITDVNGVVSKLKVEKTNSCGDIEKLLDRFPLEDLHSLLIQNKDGNEIPFCDLGVYTKNRNFRLYLSSKLNKNNPLLVAKNNQFQPRPCGFDHSLEADIFFSSLISQINLENHLKALKFGTSEYDADETMLARNIKTDTQDASEQSSDLLEGYSNSSPYPEIDGFILSLISNGGRKGRVYRWKYFLATETLLYDIVGYRWCGNVQREHRSNNIMYIVDLRCGLYYQKCHDPDCQAIDYRSESKDVPYYLLPASFFDSDPWDESQNEITDDIEEDGEDELLLSAAEDVELMEFDTENGDFSGYAQN